MGIWPLLKLAQQRQSRALDFEESYDVTGPQLSVLGAIVSSPGIDQQSVGERTFIGKSTMVGIISRLEDRKLIVVEQSRSDRRRYELSATYAGTALVYTSTPELLRRNEVFLSAIPAADLDEFFQAMEVVAFHGQESRRSRYTIPDPDGTAPSIEVQRGPGRLLRASLRRYGWVWTRRITRATPQQFTALSAIHDRPGTSQSGLGEAIGTNKASVAEMVNRLAQSELVIKQQEPADMRRHTLHLSPRGESVVAELTPAARLVDDEFLSPLGEGQRESLIRGLHRLVGSRAERPEDLAR